MDAFMFDPNFHRLADFIGVDKYKRDNPETAQKIAFLSDWAESKSSDNFVDILKTIIQLKKELGTTLRGETLVKEMYKWVRLETDSDITKRLDQQKKEEIKEKEKEIKQIKKRAEDKVRSWEEKKESLDIQVKKTDQHNQRINEKTNQSIIKESTKYQKAGTSINKVEVKDNSVEVKI